MAINRIEKSVASTGNDAVYGNGADGDVIISSNTSLTRDMYYNNLTISSGATLNPNGFRIFVKNDLTVNGSIGYVAGTSITSGTISGTAAKGSATANSIGGSSSGGTYVASQLSDSIKKNINALVTGAFFDTSATFRAITGGAGGADGSAGTVTPATSGGTGTLTARNPLAPGGPGTSGTNVPAAAAGVGNIGGAVVVICAKNVYGTGSLSSAGGNATAGGSSASGSNGSAAPNQAVQYHTDNIASYIGGDGTHGSTAHVTAPALPTAHRTGSGHLSDSWIKRFVHRNNVYHSVYLGHGEHNVNCQGGYNYHHNYNHGVNTGSPWGAPSHYSDSNFYHINGINHSSIVGVHSFYNHHNFNTTPVYFPHCAHSYYDIKGGVQHNHGTWPHQHHDNYEGTVHFTVDATVKHVGHFTAPGGTAGVAGSTTAGTAGIAGGGGGLIIITENALPVSISTNVGGGTVPGSSSASSGTVITILNK